MREYIEREAVLLYAKMLVHTAYERKEKITDDEIEKLVYGICADFTDAELGAIPAADVVEVRHGRWEERIVDDPLDPYGFFRRRWYCSSCGRYQTYGTTAFCPKCGARMDKEDDET